MIIHTIYLLAGHILKCRITRLATSLAEADTMIGSLDEGMHDAILDRDMYDALLVELTSAFLTQADRRVTSKSAPIST